MHAAAEVPTIWDQLAENMYLKGSPAAEVALSAGTSVSFARVRSEVPQRLKPALIDSV